MFFTEFILFPAFSVKYFQSSHFVQYQQVSDNLLSRVVQIDRNSKLNNSRHSKKNRNRNEKVFKKVQSIGFQITLNLFATFLE